MSSLDPPPFAPPAFAAERRVLALTAGATHATVIVRERYADGDVLWLQSYRR